MELFFDTFSRENNIITYPKDPTKHGDMAVLQVETDEWQDNRGMLTIKQTVTGATIDGTMKIIEQDSAKTKSSLRTLPLVGERPRLLSISPLAGPRGSTTKSRLYGARATAIQMTITSS